MGKLINKTQHYTNVNNKILQNNELGLKERGLLITLLSLPNDWHFSVSGLSAILPDGNDSIRKSVNRLEALGYVKRIKTKDESGLWSGYDWQVFDVPLTENPSTENPSTENPTTENPSTEKPSTENPSTENPTQYNTNKENTNKENTNKEITNKEIKHRHGEYRNVLLTDAELERLKQRFGNAYKDKIKALDEGIELKGYKYKSHYLAVLKWAKNGKNDKPEINRGDTYEDVYADVSNLEV